ncbi:MAG: hypothetical protein U9N84_11655 [Actinomycetota bacterium]|nr:hypothetical protein [Actinomycetota bacterium]
MRVVLLSVMIVLAACSGGQATPPTSVPNQDPVAVAGQWLEAVADVDTDTLTVIVEPVGLAVIAGVENGLRSDELVALLEGPLDIDLAESYWKVFRDDFEAIRGVPVTALIVGAERPIEDMSAFTAVEVSSGETGGRIVARRADDSGWQVDMAATVGPALVGPLGEYLSSALEGAHAAAISDAYRTGIVPALDAAIVLDPQNADLVFETEFIRQLLTP